MKYNPLRDNEKKYILLNFFALRGNEIKYVEKQRKLLHFFPTCGNKRITYSPVSLLNISFYFLEVI